MPTGERRRKIRARTRPATSYLVQEREGQEDKVVVFTEALAKRSDMFSISADEAHEILREQYPEMYEVVENAQPTTAAPAEVKTEGSPVIEEAAKDNDFIEVPEPVVPKNDPKNIFKFDPDTDPEILMVRSFRSKNQVELFLLGKGIEVDDAANMKLDALKADAETVLISSRMEKENGES